MQIILASTSIYRRQCLDTLRLDFTTAKPEVDETTQQGETAAQLVARLAEAKAQAVAADENTFVIGSDQVATLDGDILGKPHSEANAIAQLQRFSGKRVRFLTGLCLRHGDTCKTIVEPFDVVFRDLDDATIRRYIALEQPLNCAGSFKSEGLGILLFSALEGRDPNALIGLPLIALNELFSEYGADLLVCAK
ncbi:Maf family nucleotide pyrophosphatase [Cardiobacteriaceae bacterium TAE3-ERU3]|nr:Maf family nucleotide pyrophosphatase [Cardiobacteriaceae bacterium TAE3-ERU3]